jgi:hypothetical protein
MLFDPTLTSDEKIAGSQLCIQQFMDAYLAWLPNYLAYLDSLSSAGDLEVMSRLAMEEKSLANLLARGRLDWKALRSVERKEGRRFSAVTAKSLIDAHGHVKSLDQIFTALFAEAVDTEENTADDTSDAKAAVVPTEPVLNHSAAQILVSQIRSLIPAA